MLSRHVLLRVYQEVRKTRGEIEIWKFQRRIFDVEVYWKMETSTGKIAIIDGSFMDSFIGHLGFDLDVKVFVGVGHLGGRRVVILVSLESIGTLVISPPHWLKQNKRRLQERR